VSYTDPEDEVPPTVVARAIDVVGRERGFILDGLLLVLVAISLATATGVWPFVGLGALMLHVITTYRGKR